MVSPSTGPMRILDSGQSFHRELWVFAKTLQILFDFSDYFFHFSVSIKDNVEYGL